LLLVLPVLQGPVPAVLRVPGAVATAAMSFMEWNVEMGYCWLAAMGNASRLLVLQRPMLRQRMRSVLRAIVLGRGRYSSVRLHGATARLLRHAVQWSCRLLLLMVLAGPG
jgi:hypothetical protein